MHGIAAGAPAEKVFSGIVIANTYVTDGKVKFSSVTPSDA
jgi:hypothetical protein